MTGGEGAILVTGAASGIGRATAAKLVESGRAVVGADLDEPGLASVRAELGSRFDPVCIDLADAEAILALLARLSSGQPSLSAIVHSAALFPPATLSEITIDLWDKVMAVNVRAAFVLARAAPAAFGAGGSLVFLTSGSGLIEAANDPFQRPFALYGSSKAALDRFAAGVTDELASFGIAVTTITPGAFVPTPGTAQIDTSTAPTMATTSASRVAVAVAWLASAPRMEFAGKRLSALDFGRSWAR